MDDIRLEKRTIQERLIIAKTLIETALSDLPPAEKKGEWIPVSERLPEEDTEVLVCSDENNIEVASLSRSTEIEGAVIWLTSGWRFGKVTAWMPLPEPYKGGEE